MRTLRVLLACALASLAPLVGLSSELTSEQDHRRMLSLLGIDSLRAPANPRTGPNIANYDESKANPYPQLPDPLTFDDGRKVKTPRDWERRRAEIMETFDREIYGRVPRDVPSLTWHVTDTLETEIDGVPVVTRQLAGRVDNSAYPSVSVEIQMSLTTPRNVATPVPVMLSLSVVPGSYTHQQTKDWQSQLLQRGWGFALLAPTTVQPDSGNGLTSGIIGLVNRSKPRAPDDWGALRAWAWGASRALDYLEADPAVDARHVGIEGLSRYGKAALLAMAYDTRFAVAFIGSSGAGGAKLLRRDYGERVENLASPAQYHWMAGNFLKYAGPLGWDDLPVDAHELIALCAPRPVFIGAGSEEHESGWVDARGTFLAAVAAGPVYRLLGGRDLGTPDFPPQETALVSGDLAFRQHAEGHTNVPNWPTFIRFASRYLPSPRPLLHPLFSHHAVLQRERPIPVWGWTEPRANVSVQLGTVTAEAIANESGRWEVTLPPIPAGGPHTLLARSGNAEQSARDILVGDVFLCSGQSNMALQVHRTLDSRAEIARATDGSIRMFTVPMEGSAVPLEMVAPATRWQPASPQTVPDFSAACFYFARELKRHVPVPMGLLHASWGGSNIKTWLSQTALEGTGRYERELNILRRYPSDPVAANREWGSYWEKWYRSREPSSSPLPWTPRGNSGSWKPAPAGLGHWESWNVPELAAYNGIVWYRTAFVLNAAQARSAATLSLGTIDEVDHTWVNGRFVGSESGAGTQRVYEIAPGILRAGENNIVIAALDTYATGGIYGPAEQRVLRLEDGSTVPLDGTWQYQLPPEGLGTPPRAPWETVSGLSILHNAMIAPLAPFAVRGAVWYQGESNTDDAANYPMLLSTLMKDWRGKFGGDLPFLVVQLANYGPPATAPQESGWPELREAQRQTVARDSHAALAVAIDIGDRYDIHPANKQELARRLARAARSVIYGESIAPSGPVPETVRREGEQIAVTFRDVEGELLTYGSDRVIGFELCGAEPGTCSYSLGTVEGNIVRLPAPQDRAPARVRFCWADSPVCNLYDRAGLPAGPFEERIH